MAKPVRVGLIGSQFIAHLHAEAFKMVPQAELWAVYSPTPGHAEALARKFGIPHHQTDYQKFLEMDELDLVVIGVPNDLHCEFTVKAAAAGKHVICERSRCA